MQTEHRALIYSLVTFRNYSSSWMSSEDTAIKAALAKCYEAEKAEYQQCGPQSVEQHLVQRGDPHAIGEGNRWGLVVVALVVFVAPFKETS